VCLYVNFQFFLLWSRDHFSAPFRGLYLPNAWSQTLQTSKRHTFKFSAFHPYYWFRVKLFPLAVRRIVEGYHKNAKMLFFGSGSANAIKFRNFHDSTRPHLHSNVCRRNRGDPSSLRVRYKYYKKYSRLGLVLSRPRTDCGLSRPTSVFRTTSVCKILSRSVEVWHGQKPVYELKQSLAKPMLRLCRQLCSQCTTT